MNPATQARAIRADFAPLMRHLLGGAVLALAALGLAGQGRAQVPVAEMIASHGYSFYGDLSYPDNFSQFTYVNPDAPQGGEIALWAPGTFDSMNPYTRRGRAGLYSWALYESLMESSGPFGDNAPADVYGEEYCLLCSSLEYPASKDWVIFHMRPEARFSDGTPLTAHDVVFSHNLFLEQGLPSYSQAVSERVIGAVALDDYTVRFDFAPGISRRSLIDQVGATAVFSQAWYERTGARLDESRLEVSPGSGPYVLEGFEINRRITYRRNPEYWGADLPQNRGRHNFDSIRVEYFADDAVAFEAFKTGEYTYRAEGSSRQWAVGYDFPAVTAGHVVRAEIPDRTPPTPSGFVFNLGRPQLADRRVREALSLAYNFEWTNQQLQYGLMSQLQSFTQGSRLEAFGVPEGAELALLQSLGDLVAPELLTETAVMPHTSSASQLRDRRNLRRADTLLAEAGWTVGADAVRRNAAGEALTIEIPYPSSSSSTLESILESFSQNLAQLGIDVRTQKVDPAQYTERERGRDYEIIFDGYSSFLDTGTGLHQTYGTSGADDVFNPAGLRSPLVDAVIDLSLNAPSPDERDTALRVLDRVLRWERFMIPTWYNANEWVAYWDVFRHPDDLPIYSSGALDWWWYDADRAAELRASGALR